MPTSQNSVLNELFQLILKEYAYPTLAICRKRLPDRQDKLYLSFQYPPVHAADVDVKPLHQGCICQASLRMRRGEMRHSPPHKDKAFQTQSVHQNPITLFKYNSAHGKIGTL
jgi:hypothetical protein